MNQHINHLLEFLRASPTPFHCVENARSMLDQAGFTQLYERDDWSPLAPGRYYVCRNDSAMVAFQYHGRVAETGFRIVGAHTDSPCLRLKPNAITISNGYVQFGVEVYGGALLNPWFDRDLGLAGRVTVQDPRGMLQSILLNVTDPIAFIPSLAIHLDREVNERRSINKQKHLPPMVCRLPKKVPDFATLLRAWLKKYHGRTEIDAILGYELSLYDLQPPAVVGLNREFIASARLDNLLSCHAALVALTTARGKGNRVVALNDHEEVGSASLAGAEGPFLQSVLDRLGDGEQTIRRALDRSMMVSADNAHGVHPNFPELHEPEHQPLIGEGPVIKINHNQRYATNSETEALFRAVCRRAKIPCQQVVVRSDMGCGSTIGPITATQLGIRTVDIGVPQLGMHSIRELAGVRDQEYLVKALKGFFSFSPWPF